jgi:ABC-2 type transport system permease protein
VNPVVIVARRELLALGRARSVIAAGTLLGLVVGGMPIFTALATGRGAAGIYLQAPVLGVFLGYLFAQQAFLREKQDGTIETVLASPLTLPSLWAGKVAGCAGAAALIALVCTGGALAAAALAAHVPVPLTPGLVVHLAVLVPLVTAVAVGLLGLVQLVLGLRENQLLNIGLVMGLIVLLSVGQVVVGEVPSAGAEAASVLGMALVLALLYRLAGRVDRERIVRTIG